VRKNRQTHRQTEVKKPTPATATAVGVDNCRVKPRPHYEQCDIVAGVDGALEVSVVSNLT